MFNDIACRCRLLPAVLCRGIDTKCNDARASAREDMYAQGGESTTLPTPPAARGRGGGRASCKTNKHMKHTQMIGMIGLGNLGTALANLIAANGYAVLGWEYHATVVAAINNEHANPQFLPGVPLDRKLRATSRVEDVVEQCATIFVALVVALHPANAGPTS